MSPSATTVPLKQYGVAGFTLVEALVAMAIFMLGFGGLYVFYALSQHSIRESEHRLFLNMLGDRIIQTVAAEAQRSSTDPDNPFVNPSRYSGSLNSCDYNDTDIRQSWCKDLEKNVGPYSVISGNEIRKVALNNDGTGLIINVSLVVADGRISAYFTRKLRQL